MRACGDPDGVEAVVDRVLPRLASLSAKLDVIDNVGHRENVGHKLVSRECVQRLERSWRSEVRAAGTAELEAEYDLVSVLWRAKKDAGPDEPPLLIPDKSELTLAILRDARGEIRSQGVSSRTIRRSPRLAWDTLKELLGEDELRRRVERLRATAPEGADELLELADKYLSGWTPDRFP